MGAQLQGHFQKLQSHRVWWTYFQVLLDHAWEDLKVVHRPVQDPQQGPILYIYHLTHRWWTPHGSLAVVMVINWKPDRVEVEFLGIWSYFQIYSWDHSLWISQEGANLLPQMDFLRLPQGFTVSYLEPQAPIKALLSVDGYQILLRGGYKWKYFIQSFCRCYSLFSLASIFIRLLLPPISFTALIESSETSMF